ncbi:hypothetical protein IJL65_03990 [bacterium]|nr:hypothetical protein [bacterium]
MLIVPLPTSYHIQAGKTVIFAQALAIHHLPVFIPYITHAPVIINPVHNHAEVI